MKIIVTKDEFAKIMRECERKTSCSGCVMNIFCQNGAQVEEFCEIEVNKE